MYVWLVVAVMIQIDDTGYRLTEEQFTSSLIVGYMYLSSSEGPHVKLGPILTGITCRSGCRSFESLYAWHISW